MVIHRVIVLLMTVRAGHFSNIIWSKDVGGTFCWSVCKFLAERAVWRPSGWTGLVMNRDVRLWYGVSVCWHCDGSSECPLTLWWIMWVFVDTVMDHVSVRWHCDGSCWLNLKGQSLDPEDEGTTIFQNTMHCSPHDTVSHAVRLEPSVCNLVMTQNLTNVDFFHQSRQIQLAIYCIFLNKCHCTCTRPCNCSVPVC